MARTPAASYFLTRVVFIRCLGLVYGTAFTVSLLQNPPLLGDRGLLPACAYLARLNVTPPDDSLSAAFAAYTRLPTLLWFTGCSTATLQAFAGVGAALSGWMVVAGSANALLLATLWLLYHSINAVGQSFFSFGWESQLLETGFLAVYVVPLWSLQRANLTSPPSGVVRWAYRWLIFRIMLGAGLIKIRGDACWTDMAAPCMAFHYETQPVPSPVSLYLHSAPVWFQAVSTCVNHFVELLAPVLLLLPHRRSRLIGGSIQVLFQVMLIVSGNLSFLNHLTILPSIWCFDDASLAWLFPAPRVAAVQGDDDEPAPAAAAVTAASPDSHTPDTPPAPSLQSDGLRRRPTAAHKAADTATAAARGGPSQRVAQPAGRDSVRGCRRCQQWSRRLTSTLLLVLLVYRSRPVVENLLSPTQAMNRGFDPFLLVNTYGAFGSVGKVRTELVVLGTNSSDPGRPQTVWHQYEFPCKPTDIDRRPCVITPYHYRMDWLLWFLAMGNYHQYPWVVHLVAQLLSGRAHEFLAVNPFPDPSAPPKYIRIDHYEYQFAVASTADAPAGDTAGAPWETGVWWRRRRIGEWLPALDADNPSLHKFVAAHGWEPPSPPPSQQRATV